MTDDAERFRVVPAAYVALLRPAAEGGEEVLLQLRRGTGFMDGRWACGAAGHVEAGESVLEAAAREAREELGVEVLDLEPLTTLHRTGGTGRAVDERVDWFFGCRRWRGEPRLLETAKAADLRWWPLAALPDLVVPHEGEVLAGHAAGTLRPIGTFGFDPDEAAAQAAAAGG
jgi:8-oxo-dGTP diphosphatase